MIQSTQHPLEDVLLAIGRADPRPWDYKDEARQVGYDPLDIEGLLEQLWLEGLITKADSATGAGVVLTPLGREVLEDPEARQRLREGEAITSDQGALVRNSLRRPIHPFVTRLLLYANLAVFAYCVWLAQRHNLLSIYLTSRIGDRVVQQVYRPAGAVTALDVIRGDWWRLLTSCFVHAGILHILLNMYTLHAAGRFVEQTWGHGRYLVIYLTSGWAGALFGLAYSPFMVVGASGALCGILAADGVWIYLNGKHLPRALVRRGRSQFWTNVVLMTFISFLPGISAWGHLAGALAGAAAGVLLHFQRFGPLLLRVAAPVALLPLVWYPYAFLQDMRARNKTWEKIEVAQFENELLPDVRKTMRRVNLAYGEVVEPARDRHPERREPEQVEAALASLDEQLSDLSGLERRLKRTGPYRVEEAEDARKAAIEYTQAREEVTREARRCLTQGKAWTGADEKTFKALQQQLREKRQAWEGMLER